MTTTTLHVNLLLLITVLAAKGSLAEDVNIHCMGESCDAETENIYLRESQEPFPHDDKVVSEKLVDDEVNPVEATVKASEEYKDIQDATDVGREFCNELEIEDGQTDEANADIQDELPAPDTETHGYEFPPVATLGPDNVGEVVEVELEPGKIYRQITRSVRPPVFEIPDFLTPEECDVIINKAVELGLEASNLFGTEIRDKLESGVNTSDIDRISRTTWLRLSHFSDEFWGTLHSRLSKLTEIPVDVIKRSEPIQVVNYGPVGHYHAHIDTTGGTLPCCFQTDCGDKVETPQWAECCRLCRLVTVLYFLNDVEAGGETAFPLADMPDDVYQEKFVNLKEQKWPNLSKFCHNSSLVLAPRKGTAVMWYNHFLDNQGYLGPPDERTHHGGCDVIKGTKWIANNWISIPAYNNRFTESLFYTGT